MPDVSFQLLLDATRLTLFVVPIMKFGFWVLKAMFRIA
jgi:hypothetical protein